MSLARLLIQLRPLLLDCEQNWSQITSLLERHQDLAEYEVARHLVARTVEPHVETLVESEDPLHRLHGLDMVRLVYSTPLASRHIRRRIKDADRRVASRARAIMRAMELSEVALPDARSPLPARVRGLIPGGFNPSGWCFGAFRVLTNGWGGERRVPAGGSLAPPLAPAEARAGLPELPDPQALAALLGYGSPTELVRFLRPGSRRGSPYVDFEVPKRSGGTRLISAPRAGLRAIQRTILRRLLDPLPLHDAAHGFVRGRSTVSNARPHLGAELVIKLDLREFFPSIHYRRVRGLFRHYGYGVEVASLLAGLTTRRPVLADGRVAWPGVLPQGAPTSPALANLVCRRLDARLSGLAERLGATYTRYADDLTFSWQAEESLGIGRFLWWVDQICQQEGFAMNAKKRRVLRPSAQQRITGVVVNEALTVPRSERRRFRAILHNCRKHGVDSQARGRSDFRDYLRGYASYVRMVQPKLGAELTREVEELLGASG